MTGGEAGCKPNRRGSEIKSKKLCATRDIVVGKDGWWEKGNEAIVPIEINTIFLSYCNSYKLN